MYDTIYKKLIDEYMKCVNFLLSGIYMCGSAECAVLFQWGEKWPPGSIYLSEERRIG